MSMPYGILFDFLCLSFLQIVQSNRFVDKHLASSFFFFFFVYNIILFFTNLLLHWYFELHLFLFYLSMVFGSCFNEWTNTIGCVSITTWVSSYSVIIFSMIWLWFKMFWRAAKICLIQIPKGATMLIVTPSKMHLIVIYASTSRIVISLNYPLDLLYS